MKRTLMTMATCTIATLGQAQPINIGNRREVFWDNFIVDQDKTTATLTLHHPQFAGTVLVHDEPYEGDGCDYHNILKDDDRYRMYYLGWAMPSAKKTPRNFTPQGIRVCYAESKDGINWTKPKLGLRTYNGNKENNIILDSTDNGFDNFMVFKDENPNCKPEHRYKATAYSNRHEPKGLWCYVSPDGINFTRGWNLFKLEKGQAFDSLNVAFWDSNTNLYHAYFRGFHNVQNERLGDKNVRDIRHATSTDFINWTEAKLLDFGKDAEDYPLYTNVIEPYPRAPHLFVGFPTRYVERSKWSDSFDKLTGAQERKERMTLHPRYGLTITDCIFISSRNGDNFTRFDEAFVRPGPERQFNWVYGDCYPARGLVRTPGTRGHDDEISLYIFHGHWHDIATELQRYTLRIDGFASYQATYKPQALVTKPLVFSGNSLTINFATSARGSAFVEISDLDGNSIKSSEVFGDSIDRLVGFTDDLAQFQNKPVIITFTLSDANLYSFQFK